MIETIANSDVFNFDIMFPIVLFERTGRAV